MPTSPQFQILASWLWVLLALGLLLLVLAPLFIWRGSARTNQLLRRLLAEQERTADLLALVLAGMARRARPGADNADVATPDLLDPDGDDLGDEDIADTHMDDGESDAAICPDTCVEIVEEYCEVACADADNAAKTAKNANGFILEEE